MNQGLLGRPDVPPMHTMHPYLVATPIRATVPQLEGTLDERLAQLRLGEVGAEDGQDPTHGVFELGLLAVGWTSRDQKGVDGDNNKLCLARAGPVEVGLRLGE